MTDQIPSSGGEQQASLPPEFNDVEHFQSVVRNYINREILQDFHDLGDETWQPHIGTSRASMRVALTHKDEDSLLLTHGRMMLYYMTFGKAAALQAPVYGTPITTFHESVAFYPQIRLYFSEDLDSVESGFDPITSETTFRLMHETGATFTPTKAKEIALKIKALFCASKGFTWKKGREKWVYKDESKGYDFRLLAWDEAEAKKLIEQVLDIQSHNPDWSLLGVATKKKHYVTVPGNHTIYGKSRRQPRDRPIGYVRFRYAELKIWGMNDVTLVDRTGFRHAPLIKA